MATQSIKKNIVIHDKDSAAAFCGSIGKSRSYCNEVRSP